MQAAERNHELNSLLVPSSSTSSNSDQDDDYTGTVDDEKSSLDLLPPPAKTRRSSSAVPTIRSLLLLFCTLVNGILFARSFTKSHTGSTPVHKLRFPNQYPGLDRLFAQTGTPWLDNERVTGFPLIVQQIDSARPSFSSDEDPKRHLTNFGTIDPEDRQLLVTSTISTIVQFRARDYGMKSCNLRFLLPSSARSNSSSSSTSQHREWKPFATGSQMIDLWKLDVPEDTPLVAREVTYARRPKRVQLVDTLELVEVGEQGHNIEAVSIGFPCSMGSIHTFEVACAAHSTVACDLDIWQDKQDPPIGLTMQQRFI